MSEIPQFESFVGRTIPPGPDRVIMEIAQTRIAHQPMHPRLELATFVCALSGVVPGAGVVYKKIREQ